MISGYLLRIHDKDYIPSPSLHFSLTKSTNGFLAFTCVVVHSPNQRIMFVFFFSYFADAHENLEAGSHKEFGNLRFFFLAFYVFSSSWPDFTYNYSTRGTTQSEY